MAQSTQIILVDFLKSKQEYLKQGLGYLFQNTTSGCIFIAKVLIQN